MKKLFIKNGESGLAMIMVLIMLALGSLIVVPTLTLSSTNLEYQRVVERNTLETYAADAGAQYAIFELSNNPGAFGPETLSSTINGKTVTVIVENVDSNIYKITSTATTDGGSSTTIESYVELAIGLFDNAITSQADISVGKDCTVTGDIYYGGEFTYGHNFVQINGVPIQGEPAFSSQQENENFAQIYKEEALAGDTYEGDKIIPNNQGTIYLGPLYITGNLEVGKDNIIVVEGTIYVEGNIDMDKYAEFTGSGSIVAVGDIHLAKASNYGPEGNSVIMSLNGDITFRKEATIEALIYAPNGTISFKKKANVIGAVVGVNIQSYKDSSFIYDEDIWGRDDLPGGFGGPEIITWQIF